MLRFAADEASLLPISWLAFSLARFDRIDVLFANLRVSSVFAVFQEIVDRVIHSNQLIQRFLEPASVVLVVVYGSFTRKLVDSSNQPGRFGPLGSALSLQIFHFRYRHTDLQRTRVHNTAIVYRGGSQRCRLTPGS